MPGDCFTQSICFGALYFRQEEKISVLLGLFAFSGLVVVHNCLRMGMLSTTQLETGAFLSCVETAIVIVMTQFSCELYLKS